MSQIPAPLLSRHLGGVVVVLSVLAAAGLLSTFAYGYWALVVGIVLTAVQQAFLALAILVIGRTGLAGRHAWFPVLATLGSAGILVLDALAEVAGVILASFGPLPSVALVTPIAAGLAALTAVLLMLFGITVLRAAVVPAAARILPLVAGLAVLGAAIAVLLNPYPALLVVPAVAVLLTGGIGLALFTPRTLH